MKSCGRCVNNTSPQATRGGLMRRVHVAHLLIRSREESQLRSLRTAGCGAARPVLLLWRERIRRGKSCGAERVDMPSKTVDISWMCAHLVGALAHVCQHKEVGVVAAVGVGAEAHATETRHVEIGLWRASERSRRNNNNGDYDNILCRPPGSVRRSRGISARRWRWRRRRSRRPRTQRRPPRPPRARPRCPRDCAARQS